MSNLQEMEINEFLDDLRDSAEVNMFGATSHILAEFDVTKQEAKSVLASWLNK